MNMSMSVTRRLEPFSWSTATVAKPPERVIVDRKSAWNTVSPVPRPPKVRGFADSSRM